MPTAFEQRETGWFRYPSGWRKALFKLPLLGWRLGLGPVLGRAPFRLLILTTRGRNSGQPRHTALEHSVVEGKTYVAPGWGSRTQWYRNILADPLVTVQARGGSFGAIARPVIDPDEARAVYRQIHGKSPVWKQYLDSWGVEDTEDDFVAKVDWLCPIRLDPIERVPLQPLRADLLWVWPIAAALAAVAMWLTCFRR